MTLLPLVVIALAGFAANSLLTRAALGGGHLDPMSFMVVRLVSGALLLSALVSMRTATRTGRGSWLMALMLAGYAVTFTLAYTRISAGAGALLLFAAVHLTMFVAGLARGERPSLRELAGTLLAIAGLVVLTMPGLEAPDLRGAALMVVAGACWGVYSLEGRRSIDPLATTADNFRRALLVSLPVALLARESTTVTSQGLVMAIVSGGVASGLAYAIWYSVLPRLASWRAALLQLAVPVITAAAAVVVLAEPMTMRLVAALTLVVSGIALTTPRAPSRPARDGGDGARA